MAEELLPHLREQLVALLENEALTPQQRAEAGDALGKSGRSAARRLHAGTGPDRRFQRANFIYGKKRRRAPLNNRLPSPAIR